MNNNTTYNYWDIGCIGQITRKSKTIEECEEIFGIVREEEYLLRKELEDYFSLSDTALKESIKPPSLSENDYVWHVNSSLSFMAGEDWVLSWYLGIESCLSKSQGVRSLSDVSNMIQEFKMRQIFELYSDIIVYANFKSKFFNTEDQKRLEQMEVEFLSEDNEFSIDFIQGCLHALHWIIGQPLLFDGMRLKNVK